MSDDIIYDEGDDNGESFEELLNPMAHRPDDRPRTGSGTGDAQDPRTSNANANTSPGAPNHAPAPAPTHAHAPASPSPSTPTPPAQGSAPQNGNPAARPYGAPATSSSPARSQSPSTPGVRMPNHVGPVANGHDAERRPYADPNGRRPLPNAGAPVNGPAPVFNPRRGPAPSTSAPAPVPTTPPANVRTNPYTPPASTSAPGIRPVGGPTQGMAKPAMGNPTASNPMRPRPSASAPTGAPASPSTSARRQAPVIHPSPAPTGHTSVPTSAPATTHARESDRMHPAVPDIPPMTPHAPVHPSAPASTAIPSASGTTAAAPGRSPSTTSPSDRAATDTHAHAIGIPSSALDLEEDNGIPFIPDTNGTDDWPTAIPSPAPVAGDDRSTTTHGRERNHGDGRNHGSVPRTSSSATPATRGRKGHVPATSSDDAPKRRRGQRGPDRHPRARRERIGDVALSEEQTRLLDRVNRHRDHGSSFVMTDRDRRVFDYLARWRFATRADTMRIGGWRGWYGRKSHRLNEYRRSGFATVKRIPLSQLDYARLTPAGVSLSDYAFLGSEPETVIVSGQRSHTLGLSSLASQLLAVDPDYDGESFDLLGLGAQGWARLREDIRRGDAKVIAEREYRSAWSRIRHGQKSRTAITDARYRGAIAGLYRKYSEGPRDDEMFDWHCCDPQYRGETAWLWTVFGSDIVTSDRTDSGRPQHIPIERRGLDENGRPVLDRNAGDRFSTRDHLPDMVIARRRDRDTCAPRSLAIELELTAKAEEDYDVTMSAYMSGNGKLLYDRVIWLVVQGATANVIRRGATRAGAVEGVDYTIVPVASDDVRSSFYDGFDMRRGRIDRTPAGAFEGYSMLRDIEESVDRDNR